MSAGDPDLREDFTVVNLGEPDITLGKLIDEAAGSLEHLESYTYDGRSQEQFKTADGRWWIIEYVARLNQVDCPTCDHCREDLTPDTIGVEGPDRVLCKSCLARR